MRKVALLVVPGVLASHVAGIYDFLSGVPNMWKQLTGEPGPYGEPVFEVQLVGLQAGHVAGYNDFPITAKLSIDDLDAPDVVIVPGIFNPRLTDPGFTSGELIAGEHQLLNWLQQSYQHGAMVMAIGSGNYFLAASGLLRGADATAHWACHVPLSRRFPEVQWHNGETMVTNASHPNIISVGGGPAWYEGVRQLISRFSSAADATNAAKAYNVFKPSANSGLYTEFLPAMDHGDDLIAKVQDWLALQYANKNLVTEAEVTFPLSPRSLKRRFKKATGLTLIGYIHELRLKQAKLLLEESSQSLNEIAEAIGYADISYFRRIFSRELGMTPAEYRQLYRLKPNMVQQV